MRRTAVQALLLMSGAIAIPACGWANTVIVTDNGSVVIVNGHVVSGSSNVVVGKGPVQTEQRTVGAFSGLRVAAPANVTFHTSEKPSVAVTAPANVLPLIETDVRNGVLVIGLRGSVVLSSPITVAASAPALASINLAGAGNVEARGLAGPELGISVGGSGTVTATGEVGRIAVSVAGSGDVDVAAIHANEVRGSVSGSGTVRAFARERVEAEIAGSGELIIFGNPPQRATRVAGSGEILFR
jgi:hypothetical protein